MVFLSKLKGTWAVDGGLWLGGLPVKVLSEKYLSNKRCRGEIALCAGYGDGMTRLVER